MGNIGRLVLGTSSLFMVLMAVMLNSPELFYMCTALLATLGAARLQAYLSVRGLRLERVAPPAAHVGEEIPVSITVWSDRRINRPLVTVVDGLPSRLITSDRTPSLPVAPAFDQPVQTRYRFRPLKRGKYKWNSISVEGTDALGLMTMTKTYTTEPAELTVYPTPITVQLNLDPAAGWGSNEAESGRFRGAGIEPRGVREYAHGDPLRHVHWASSARAGRLMVKEFEAGAELCAVFAIQRTRGSEIGTAQDTTLEAMCSHVAYLSERFLHQGAQVFLAGLDVEARSKKSYDERKQEIYDLLAGVQCDEDLPLSQSLIQTVKDLPGGALYLLISVQDPHLPATIRKLSNFQVFCLVYDPKDYVAKQMQQTAADEGYLGQLHASGAKVVLMPKPEVVK